MKQQRKFPERTCVACRTRSEQTQLLRFGVEKRRAESPAVLPVEMSATEKQSWHVYRVSKAGAQQKKAQGRSAYLHVNVECARKASAFHAWEHAFRLKRGSLCEATLRACIDEVMAEALKRATSLQRLDEQNADRDQRSLRDGPKRRKPRMRL